MQAFIVHGHEKIATLELKNFLLNLGIEPVVLEEQDDNGLTIIEKFEHYAKLCKVAFVIMTPDDTLIPSKLSSEIKTARHNTMIELGWFMSYLGRKSVLILHKKGTDIPTDISGILYLAFDNTIMEVSEKIRVRLKGLGLI